MATDFHSILFGKEQKQFVVQCGHNDEPLFTFRYKRDGPKKSCIFVLYLHVRTLGPTSTLIDIDGVVVPPNPTVPPDLLCILSNFLSNCYSLLDIQSKRLSASITLLRALIFYHSIILR